MNQFIIENPVFSIVIAFIIGAVIMNITSVLAVRMAVEKEVERALGDEGVEEETRAPGNVQEEEETRAPGNVQEEEDTKEPWAREREKLWKEITENRESSALPEQDEEEETREPWDEDFSFTPNITIIVYLGVDGDGCRCLYLAAPDHYKQGEGPLPELGHDYYYHPTLQFLADDFDLDKLAELDIDIRPEKEYEPMAFSLFILKGKNVLKFLEEAFNACGKAIARE